MVVCVCANKNQNDIQQAIAGGCDTFEQLVDEHNICANCQTCYDVIQELLTVNTDASIIS